MLTWEDSVKPFVPEVKDRSEDSSSEDCVVADSLDVIFYFFLQNIRKYENDKVKAKQKEKTPFKKNDTTLFLEVRIVNEYSFK